MKYEYNDEDRNARVDMVHLVFGEGHLAFNIFALVCILGLNAYLGSTLTVATVLVLINLLISVVGIARRYAVSSALLRREQQAAQEQITGQHSTYAHPSTWPDPRQDSLDYSEGNNEATLEK